MIKFKILGRPRPQKRPKVYGKKATDPSAAEKQAFLFLAAQFRPDVPPTGPVAVDLTFAYQALGRSADVDNLAKFVLDALNGTFFKDDRQVVELTTRKIIDPDESTQVEIRYLKKRTE